MQKQGYIFFNLTKLSRSTKRLLIGISDFVALIAALWSAFALRLSDWWPETALIEALVAFLVMPVLGVFVFYKLNYYQTVVRYVNIEMVRSLTLGVIVLVSFFYSLTLILDAWQVPRTVPIIFGMCGWIYVGGIRFFVRNYINWASSNFSEPQRVLIYGAGSAGVQLVMALEGSKHVKPVGFVDDDPQLHGVKVRGLLVHRPSEIDTIIKQNRVSLVLLAILNLTEQQRLSIIEKLAVFPIKVSTIPPMDELIKSGSIDEFREIDVDKLLGRDSVVPDFELLICSLKDKSVCVTGAGGSIGSKLAHQALLSGARVIVLYDQSEFALYSIERELLMIAKESSFDVTIVPIIGSVQDFDRVLLTLTRFAVQTIYHAAAYKHVPMVEVNVLQGLENNALGALNVGKAAAIAGAERFVLISTDKAVRPTNVMGATKRFAELCIQDLAVKSSGKTIFCMVRFGNVLGSSGSVVPLFREQIIKGGPVTVTHPEVTRYFMNIPEAASLVVQAGSLAKGGEVFVLDMGKPIKISVLAENMIKLSGLSVKSTDNPSGDIEIMYTGLRHGEKLYEELVIGGELTPTQHAKILCANEVQMDSAELESLIQRARVTIGENDTHKARELLRDIVPEFKPASNNVDWLRFDLGDC